MKRTIYTGVDIETFDRESLDTIKVVAQENLSVDVEEIFCAFPNGRRKCGWYILWPDDDENEDNEDEDEET